MWIQAIVRSTCRESSIMSANLSFCEACSDRHEEVLLGQGMPCPSPHG